MRAGDLRTRLRIESVPDGGTNEGGDPVATTPTAVATVYASVKALSGSEAMRGMQLQARVTHEISTRWRGDVTAAMRAVNLDTGATYHFRRVVDPTGRRAELLIDADEVAA